MYFGFVRLTFLPMTDGACKNETIHLRETSGLSVHCFEKTTELLTQKYNQDLLQYWIGASVLKR